MKDFFLVNNQTGKSRKISEELTVGRSIGDLILSDNNFISAEHCKFFIKGENLYVQDLDAKNPVVINGVRLKSCEKYKVRLDDKILIGKVPFSITTRSTGQLSDSGATKVLSLDDIKGELEKTLTLKDYWKKYFQKKYRSSFSISAQSIMNVIPLTLPFVLDEDSDTSLLILSSLIVFISVNISFFIVYFLEERVINFLTESRIIRNLMISFLCFFYLFIFMTFFMVLINPITENSAHKNILIKRCIKKYESSKCLYALSQSRNPNSYYSIYKRSSSALISKIEFTEQDRLKAKKILDSLNKNIKKKRFHITYRLYRKLYKLWKKQNQGKSIKYRTN